MAKKKRVAIPQASILARTLVNFILQKHLAQDFVELDKVYDETRGIYKVKERYFEGYPNEDIEHFVRMVYREFPAIYNIHNTIELNDEERAELDNLSVKEQIRFLADLIQDKSNQRPILKSERILERYRK